MTRQTVWLCSALRLPVSAFDWNPRLQWLRKNRADGGVKQRSGRCRSATGTAERSSARATATMRIRLMWGAPRTRLTRCSIAAATRGTARPGSLRETGRRCSSTGWSRVRVATASGSPVLQRGSGDMRPGALCSRTPCTAPAGVSSLLRHGPAPPGSLTPTPPHPLWGAVPQGRGGGGAGEMHWKGGGVPRPPALQGTQPMPSHCPP